MTTITPRTFTATIASTASSRVRARTRRTRLFQAAYILILAIIAVQLTVGVIGLVTIVRTADIAAADTTRAALAGALIVFTFVLPAVAALDLHTTRTHR